MKGETTAAPSVEERLEEIRHRACDGLMSLDDVQWFEDTLRKTLDELDSAVLESKQLAATRDVLFDERDSLREQLAKAEGMQERAEMDAEMLAGQRDWLEAKLAKARGFVRSVARIRCVGTGERIGVACNYANCLGCTARDALAALDAKESTPAPIETATPCSECGGSGDGLCA